MLHLSRLCRPWPGRPAWLLWLALLLPLAQVAAASHALLHQQQLAAGLAEPGKHAPHQAPCEICLLAATIGAGGAAASAVAPPLPAAVSEAPIGARILDARVRPLPPFRSRAPPLLHA